MILKSLKSLSSVPMNGAIISGLSGCVVGLVSQQVRGRSSILFCLVVGRDRPLSHLLFLFFIFYTSMSFSQHNFTSALFYFYIIFIY